MASLAAAAWLCGVCRGPLPAAGAEQAAGSADRAAAVRSAGSGLEQWQRYPWYDPGSDDVRLIRVKVRKPPPPEPARSGSWWNWRWLDGLDFGDELLQLLGWMTIAAALGVLLYFLLAFYLNREGRSAGRVRSAAKAPPGGPDRMEALPEGVQGKGGDLLGEARRLYEAGNYAEAIIFLFSYQLLMLDRGHFIQLTKGKTNRQYLRELRGRGPLPEMVEQVMVAFEDVFFGKHALERARFERCWSRLNEFDALVNRGTL